MFYDEFCNILRYIRAYYDMVFKNSICNRITELKNKKGISWEQLLYSAGLAKSVGTEIKHARVEPKLLTVCKIALALEMTPSELLDFEINMSEVD